jgi:excinuclease UvrABC ATPase subunit
MLIFSIKFYIGQRVNYNAQHNPRSTVGTITEIYDYLRLLFARVGVPKCPTHKIDLVSQTVSQMVFSHLKTVNNNLNGMACFTIQLIQLIQINHFAIHSGT